MAFEPVYDVIKTEERRVLGESQTVVEARVVAAPDATLVRVLSADCRCSVSEAESFAGEARYNGLALISVLAVDGNGITQCLESEAQFNGKIESELITSFTKPVFEHKVLSVELSSPDNGEVTVTCVIEIRLIADVSAQHKCLVSCGEGVFDKRESIPYAFLRTNTAHSFTVSRVVERIRFDKVLKTHACAVVSSATVTGGMLTVTGEAAVNCCVAFEEGRIGELKTSVAFSEEIEASGAIEGDTAIASVSVKRAFVRVIDEDGSLSAEIELELCVAASVYGSQTQEHAADLFCLDCDMITQANEAVICSGIAKAQWQEKISTAVELSSGAEPIREILYTEPGRAVVLSAYASSGSARLNGVVYSTVVYRGEEEQVYSVGVEIPFELKFSAELSGNESLSVTPTVIDVTARERRGSLVEISAEVCFDAVIVRVSENRLIVDAQVGEKRESKKSAITVHFLKKGDTLWDVVRSACASPELIEACNPGLELPAKGSERVLIYRKLELNN